MSIMAESNVYESMAEDGLNEKLCLAACEDSGLMFIPKIERDVEAAMRGVAEETAEEKMRILHDGIIQDAYNSMEHPHIYYEEALSTCEEVEVDYKPSMCLPLTKMENEWEETTEFDNSIVDSSYDENHVAISPYHGESENVEDSDEETIATFLTAAGQRLALYAVEDSDEVFAVAVYDESGEPPTNFQFLMKADVERLIGEGAVRTVRKPTPMKKQLFSTDPPVFVDPSEEPHVPELQPNVEPKSEPTQYQNNHYNTHRTTCSDDNDDLPATEIVQEAERKSSPLPDADKQPDITYLSHLMEDACPALDVIEEPELAEKVTTENSDGDFIEQSTVQYMLLGDGDSDGELTLADVEETLKNHKPIERKTSLLKKTYRTIVDSTEENNHSSNATLDAVRDVAQNDDIPAATVENINACRFNSPNKISRTVNYMRKATTSLICRREKLIDDRPKVSSGTSLLIAKAEAKSSPETGAVTENSQIGSRVKRSRKQQLTSVNRDDSEIIIQPASFGSEEDEPTRKRGRGKRKPGRPSTYKTKAGAAKKATRASQRARAVELIEIDVDEEHRLQGKKDIVEITIDENKEKGSSDKENEVIMVGDSEDEAREAEASAKSAATILKCDHCLRSFRQKRALETHSRVCPKSPDFVRRMSEKSARRSITRSADTSMAVKKQYACKICQEKFDVVVALARHVRAMHSQRKKLNSSNQTTTPVKAAEAPPKIEETPKKVQPSVATVATDTPITSRRRKTKTKIKASKRSWKSEKLHCDDCGRWFSSDALLTAHSLQHATKKSEKQTRRCPTCKKIFKSRLLYIRHLRMHSRAKQLQKKLHHTRQASGKTTSVRKRGRPRKL